MPQFKTNRETVLVKLPSVEGGEITLHKSLMASEMDQLVQSDRSKSVVFMLKMLAKEWNLQDEAGAPLPLTEEALGRLDAADVNAILAALGITADRDFLPRS